MEDQQSLRLRQGLGIGAGPRIHGDRAAGSCQSLCCPQHQRAASQHRHGLLASEPQRPPAGDHHTHHGRDGSSILQGVRLHCRPHYIACARCKTLVLGVAGWSGAGKTTLLKKLLPLLVARGLRVATIKHAHHDFDVDVPGKDSHEHRKAGAGQVLVSSAQRWVLMHELGDTPEPTLGELLRKLGPCDLVLVEGFKRERHPKLEVYRSALGKPPLYPDDPRICGVVTDVTLAATKLPTIDLNDVPAVVDAVLAWARPMGEVLAGLGATDA